MTQNKFQIVFFAGSIVISFSLLIIILQTYLISAYGEPNLVDKRLTVEQFFVGKFKPSSMALLDSNNILLLDRDQGKVYKVSDGTQKVILDVKVATEGYRGMLGIAASTNDTAQIVFLYFTEARYRDAEDASMNIAPLGNRVYRYELVGDELINPQLILDLPAVPGPRHMGGVIEIGPDSNLYVSVGDLDGTFREGYQTLAQNYQNGSLPDGRAGILRVTQEGEPVGQGVLSDKYPLNLYYAYGIRNSFGMDWDPLTGKMWDSENGPHYGDEINLVEPGFNSGWVGVQGLWKPNFDTIGELSVKPIGLVDFDGKGKYSTPEFTWIPPVAPTALKFLHSDKLGTQYENDMFVGDANTGSIYNFDLNKERTALNVSGSLEDATANNLQELSGVKFASGFGRITDMDIGQDGFIYVLAAEDKAAVIHKIATLAHPD